MSASGFLFLPQDVVSLSVIVAFSGHNTFLMEQRKCVITHKKKLGPLHESNRTQPKTSIEPFIKSKGLDRH